MKMLSRERLNDLSRTLSEAVRHYPVELGLCLYAFVVFALTRESVLGDRNYELLTAVPLCITLAYVLNSLFTTGRGRLIYYLAWIVALPAATLLRDFFLLPDGRYPMTVGILCPLAVLLCRRSRDNRRFVTDALSYLGAGIAAALVVSVAAGLVLAIYFSITYIFGIFDTVQEGVAIYMLAAAYMLAMPLLLLATLDRLNMHGHAPRKAADMLLNWIVTPALLAYTAILYLYFLQIVVTWSLPKGGIALMVFIYMLVAAMVKGLQFVVVKPMYGWFFRRLSLFSLPPLLLFWSGCLRRIADYGLTEARVYLLLCGGLMTLYALLFLSRRTGRYLYIGTVALVVLAAAVYVPALMPERLAVRSQRARVQRLAEDLGLTDASGLIRLQPDMRADTTRLDEYRELYESMRYLARTDPEAMERMGLPDLLRVSEMLPLGWDGTDEPTEPILFIENSGKEGIALDGYRRLYITNLSTRIDQDTLRLYAGNQPERKILLSALLRQQLDASGLTAETLAVADLTANPAADAFCTFRTDSITVVFSNLILCGDNPGYRIMDVTARALLIR